MNIKKKNISIPIGIQYLLATLILFIFIVILYLVQEIIGYQTVSLILLLIIFLLPLLNFEKGPIILAAIISALAWDYYFIPPHHTLHIAKPEDVVTLFMFFIVAMTNGVLTSRLRSQKNEMTEKERRSNAFYSLLKELSVGKDLNDITQKAIQQISNAFGTESVIFYSTTHDKLNKEPHPASTFKTDEMEWFIAQLSFVNKREAGKTTETLPETNAIYFPLGEADNIFGVIGVRINDGVDSESKELVFLRNFVKEIALYLERHLAYSMP
jgi:two-component system, OmpR family, sensor histidine kinase KdpD